jgi:hypothetical protein
MAKLACPSPLLPQDPENATMLDAWNIFCDANRGRLLQGNPSFKSTDVISILSYHWHRMNKADRQYYIDLSVNVRRLSEPGPIQRFPRPMGEAITPPPAERPLESAIESICSEEVPKCDFFVPQFDIIERKQFGRSAAQASRSWSSPFETLSPFTVSSQVQITGAWILMSLHHHCPHKPSHDFE